MPSRRLLLAGLAPPPAGIPLPALDRVVVTHDHSGHVIDAGVLAVVGAT